MKSTVIRHNIKTVASVAVFFCVLALVQGGDAMASPEFGASVQAEYDSNILPEADTTTQNSGDWAWGAGAYIGWESDSSSPVDWQARYDYSATRWQQAVEFDTDLHTGFIRVGVNRGDYTSDMVVLMARADLQGKPFMQIRRLSPALGYFFTRKFYVRAQLDIGDKRFMLYPERDAKQLGARANLYWLLSRTRNYLSLRTIYRNEDTTVAPFGYESFNTRLRWKYRPNDIAYRLQGSWEVREYESVWQDIGERRQDNRFRVEAGVDWPLGKGFSLHGQVGRDLYRSNLVIADYQQYRFNTELSWEF